VVTANKALLAYHRYELQEIAKDQAFEFEASVAGGNSYYYCSPSMVCLQIT